MNNRVALLFIFFFTATSWADWHFSSENILEGAYRYWPGIETEYNYYGDGFFESSTGLSFEGTSLSFEGRLLFRNFQSYSNNENADDLARLNLTPPKRLLNGLMVNKYTQFSQTTLDIGTLWVNYTINDWQITAGRKALGLGVMKALPVWNRLKPVLPSPSGYLLDYNPDLVDVRFQSGKWTFATFASFAQKPEDQIVAFETVYYGSLVESHFLLADWWQQSAVGYAGVTDLSGTSLRIESLFVAPNKDLKGGQQIGLGVERVLSEAWSIEVEYYHSSFGTTKKNEYLTQAATPFRTLFATDYIFPKISYNITDFWAMKLGWLVNMIDGSAMFVADSTYSILNNVDIFGTLRLPTASYESEFGTMPNPMLPNYDVGYVTFAAVGLKFVF